MKGFTPPTQRERDKYRAAQEAGLLERVLEVGWAGLTAKESGRIGGLLAHKNREWKKRCTTILQAYTIR